MRAALAGLCALLTACGGKQAGTPVRIANLGSGLQTICMPVTLAYTLGYYAEEGIDATLINLPSNAKTLQALMGGSADVAVIHAQQAMQIAAEGQHVVAFFVLNKIDSKIFVVSPAASTRIHRAEDLKGALIGVTGLGTSAQLWVTRYLDIHGVRPDQVSMVGIGLGASAVAAIENSRVDAAVMTGGDQFRLLRRHPDLRILVDAGTPQGMLETYGSEAYAGGTLSATQPWLARNPDTARRLARAVHRAIAWIETHKPEEIREKLPDGFRSQEAGLDVQLIRWSQPTFTADGRMPAGAPEVLKRFLDATDEKVKNSKIDLSSTWTNEYLEAAK
jgi:NitT/TauT family transport system substrate-binding protein